MSDDRRIRPSAYPSEDMCISLSAAVALFLCMKALSRDSWGVPWATHLEKKLWDEMKKPTKVSPIDAKALYYLHLKAGGWWSWTHSGMPGPSFVPTAIWVESISVEE